MTNISPAEATPLKSASTEQKHVDMIYDVAKASIVTEKVTVSGVTIMVTAAMGAVEKIKSLNGSQKKELVLHVVNRIVGEIPADDEDKQAIQAAAALAPVLIDTLVNAARGGLGIGGKNGVGCSCVIC